MFHHAYDSLMADIDYEQIYHMIKPYLRSTDLIVDAGCGSGYLLIEFLKQGHQIIGIDMDSSMLSLAYDKLKTDELSAPLYQHDLKKPLHAKADVILAIFDVCNYMKGIKKVFYNIYQALEDGGRFIFDIYTYDCLKTYSGYVESDDSPISYHWTIRTKNQRMIHTIKLEDETKTIIQYIQPLKYYLDVLESLKFKYEVIQGPDIRKHVIIAYK
jgi:SAM-dependent methyltransferase